MMIYTKSKFTTVLEEVFIRSWWVILFLILCYMFFEQGQLRRKEFKGKLSQQISELTTMKNEQIKKQKMVTQKINSQSDPAWVELTLIRELGVVPENQQKVSFITPKERR